MHGETEDLLADDAEVLADEIGRSALGFSQVRAEQRRAAAAVLRGKDALVVLPTGAGKSAIYQIAGPARPGPSVVVSPLLALQADQVRSIGGRLGGAVVLSSEISDSARQDAFEAIGSGEVEFVFSAPEQLANDEVRAALAAAEPSLFVVDEAHLVVTWGRDFRPDYLRLGAVAEELGRPPILALTATAAPPVREEIAAVLGMDDPEVVVGDLVRHNIRLDVDLVADPAAIDDAVVARVADLAGTGLVYVAKRADAERLAHRLDSVDRPAHAYHAGLGRRRRAEVLERFGDPAPVVVVATIAFGLGIDVPHVRFVVHADAAEDLDALYQEVGRAGRDGGPSTACAVVASVGPRARRFMAGGGSVDDDTLAAVAAVPEAAGEVSLAELVGVARRPRGHVLAAVDLLVRARALEVRGDLVRRTIRSLDDGLVRARRARDRQDAVQRSRAAMLERYLSGDACRWSVLAGYLGDPSVSRCGACDVCDRSPAVATPPAGAAGPFQPGSPVLHTMFGVGTVVERDEESLTVLFAETGYRRLALELVQRSDLLLPADVEGLASLPRAALLQLAEDHGVAGRAKLRKADLAAALAGLLSGQAPH